MPVCELCGEVRPSPCVGAGAAGVLLATTSLVSHVRSKPPALITACPKFDAARKSKRGPNGELVFKVYDVRMENDLCPMTEEVLVSLDTVRLYIPHFDLFEKAAFVRAFQLAMGSRVDEELPPS